MKTKRYGFTLIELLIVVAIIAILAAIAVPNFLEAQIRSKVSRVRGELRTLATAIEAYTVDWNNPPPSAGEGTNAGVFAPLIFPGSATGQTGILTPAITTPVAYVTSFTFIDPFVSNDVAASMDTRLYTYQTYTWRWAKPPQSNGQPKAADSTGISYNEGSVLTGTIFKDLYGNWRMFSIGPDKLWSNNRTQSVMSPASVGLPYESTNGTTSLGNILRSQKETQQTRWQMVNGQ